MKFIGIIATLLVVISLTQGSIDYHAKIKFDDFMRTFKKHYPSRQEYLKRLTIFSENLRAIEEHNSSPGISWKKGINKFTDLTDDEFRSIYASGYINTVKYNSVQGGRATEKDYDVDLPASVDWREKGVVTDVKNQGFCGSCWAFTTVEMLESYLKLEEEGELKELSAQQVTSCVPNPLNCGGGGGCGGSVPILGFTYAQLFGVVEEHEYPYTSGTTTVTGDCLYDAYKTNSSVFARGYETLPHNDLKAVMQHIATVGPLAVSVAASPWGSYSSGVFDSCDYNGNIVINHAVQLVGYGTDEEHGDYWLVRNSWGRSWGENGYIRLKRESTEVCGLNSTPEFGTQCIGDGNDVQKVCGMCGILFDTAYPIGTSTNSGIKPDA